jgi:hypothetical protein
VLFPAVYRMSGSPRTGRQRAMAASLWLGKEALISHLTGAVLLKLDRLRTTQLHVTVPRSVRRRVSDPSIVLHRAVALPRQDRVVVDGIPCTSATRTILDCAGLLDEEALEIAFESARRMRLTSPTALARRAAALCGSGKAGSTKIRQLLAHQQLGQRNLDSPLEVKAARLIRAAPSPSPCGSSLSSRIVSTLPGLTSGSRSNAKASRSTATDWHGNVTAGASPRSNGRGGESWS